MSADDVVVTAADDAEGADIAVVDTGLGDFNDRHGGLDVAAGRVFAFARDGEGRLVGGAVGRRWGRWCELQQLWVADPRRGHGIGRRLLAAFEARGRSHGCDRFVLQTFSFQAPAFYARHGWRSALVLDGFPGGVERHTMRKDFAP